MPPCRTPSTSASRSRCSTRRSTSPPSTSVPPRTRRCPARRPREPSCPATGKITAWTEPADLKLPAPRAGAAGAVAGDGLFLIGGTDGKGPVDTVWKAAVNATTGKLTAWAPNATLTAFDAAGATQPAPRVHAIATVLGQNLFVWGGDDASGPTAKILRGDISTDKATLGQVTRWGSQTAASAAQQDLPAAHEGAFGWVANSNLYYGGGQGSNGEIVWAIPD